MSTRMVSDGRIAVALTATTVASALTSVQTFTVPGLKTGIDHVSVAFATAQTGLGIVNSRVSADNTLEITFANVNAGTEVVPTTAGTYFIRWERFEHNDSGVVS